jgi:hypothetical protein
MSPDKVRYAPAGHHRGSVGSSRAVALFGPLVGGLVLAGLLHAHGAWACPSGAAELRQRPDILDFEGKSKDPMYHPGLSYVFPTRTLFDEALDNAILVGGEKKVQSVLEKSWALPTGTCVKVLWADHLKYIAKVRIISGAFLGKTGYTDTIWLHYKGD